MTPTAINIAIAQTRGFVSHGDTGIWHLGGSSTPAGYLDGKLMAIPDYHGSLDAIHAATMALPWDQQCAVSLKLHEVCGSNQLNHVVNATAAQRCEAYARVLCIWEDTPTS